SGLRSVHSLVRSTREADEAIPVDLEVYAFAFDLADWPELKDKGWPGLKESVAEEFLKQDKKVDFGWGFLLEEKGQRAMGSVKLAWMPTAVAGQPGLLVQCPGRPNLYLTARPPYVIAAFTEYRTEYVNKRMGKEMPLSPEQQAVIKKTLEDFITAIKPQKGEAPTGNWAVPAK
ncbi:MAG: hypothetical protein Q8O00_01675, partial [Holophaga sp.]|nr:hypothetical protein [Holophaga sp.]